MKSVNWIIILVSLIALNLPAQQGTFAAKNEWTGTTEQKIGGLMTVWAEVKYAFPQKQKLADLNWDEKVLEYIPLVIEAKDPESYYRVLDELVALLRDSHTEIIPPWGRFKPGYDNPPVEVKIISDRFYIIRTSDTEEIRSQGVCPGMEILTVGNGIPVKQYFTESVLKYHSGNTRHGDEALYVFFLLYGPGNEKISLGIRDLDGNIREISLTRNSSNRDGSPFFYRFIRNFIKPTLEPKMVANGILYINIPNFEHNSIHEDFQKLLDATDLSAIKGLILDVRLNMGGDSAVCNHIVERLINKPVSSPLMKYPHYIAAEKAWGKEEKWNTVKSEIRPVEGKKYTGPIVILTDAITISTAEDLIIELRQRGQVLTLGETTAGGAGNGLLSPLPGGGQFRVSTFHATCPDGTEYVGSGLKPDIFAAPTLQDLCEGNDVVLQKGISVISDWGTFYTPGKK